MMADAFDSNVESLFDAWIKISTICGGSVHASVFTRDCENLCRSPNSFHWYICLRMEFVCFRLFAHGMFITTLDLPLRIHIISWAIFL